jgi:two-component system nitrogen regulation response regulator NtrX
LRERVEDIPPLVAHFAAEVAAQNGWKPKTFEPEAIQELQRYRWPGNVRELRNVVERLLLLADGPVDRAAVRLALPQAESAGPGAGPGMPGPGGRWPSARIRSSANRFSRNSSATTSA